ncbi:MAG: hypothetical protein V1899_11665 [Planctomycetota bacterium]
MAKDLAECHSGAADSRRRAETNAGNASVSWEPRIAAMKALAEYSASLQALVESGNHGANAAKAATGAVADLLSKLGAAYPAGAIGSEITSGAIQGFVAAWKAVARELAARSLAEAIEKADPTIQSIGTILAIDFMGAKKITAANKSMALMYIDEKYNVVRNEDGTPSRDDKGHEISLRKKLNDLENSRAAIRENLLDKDGKLVSERAAQLREIDGVIESEKRQQWHINYIAEKNAIVSRCDGQVAITEKAALLIKVWAASHGDLLRAVKENRAPTFTMLTTVAADLFKIYRETQSRIYGNRSAFCEE